jgi:hypothetical protein
MFELAILVLILLGISLKIDEKTGEQIILEG